MFDEMSFVVTELLPVLCVLGQIDFLWCPEACHLVFIHFPDVVVSDRQDHKSVRVLFEKGFGKRALGLGVVAVLRLVVIVSTVRNLGSNKLTVLLLLELWVLINLGAGNLKLLLLGEVLLVVVVLLVLLVVLRKNLCNFLLRVHFEFRGEGLL